MDAGHYQSTAPDFDLSMVDRVLLDRAAEAIEARDVEGLLCRMSNEKCLAFVADNVEALKAREMYERALMSAWTGTRTNHCEWDSLEILLLFSFADRDKLLAAGDPLPPGEAFTLYRGVAGKGRRRKVSGFSWTDDVKQAAWFARRYALQGLNDPALYTITVPAADVLFYWNGRNEHDFVISTRQRPKRLKLDPMQVAPPAVGEPLHMESR